MRKSIIGLLTAMLIFGCLTGCSHTDDPRPAEPQPTATVPQATESQPTPTWPTEPVKEEDPIGHEDTYWVAETWYSEDGEGAEGPQTLNPQEWTMDLLIRVDGTARFRDVRENVCLVDDSYVDLTWDRMEDGYFRFYSALYVDPALTGTYSDGIFSLEYMGLTVSMKQVSMPEKPAQDTLPAELAGTWVQVFGEVEADRWEAMPNQLHSLVFRVDSAGGDMALAADMEERDYYGALKSSAYGLGVEILEEPLYSGFENDRWSVRIGPESPLDENGYPKEVEYYATLLNYNTLLLQLYYTLDGAPSVSYLTYQRFCDITSWVHPQNMELDYTNWICIGYEGPNGEDFPAEFEGFQLVLDPNGSCRATYGDGRTETGTWLLGNGGVFLARGDEEAEDPFWFGGVITRFTVESYYDVADVHQMALYHDGGILLLVLDSYG